ncbi:hypothetical protein [Isoptericola aurantiacus]|uniref:hypothetical protein n=1 Tax=Isoptericola aurantiacus TaxID=3377839 RepID=UPI00383A09AF
MLTGVEASGSVAKLIGRVSAGSDADALLSIRGFMRLRHTQQSIEIPVQLRGKRSIGGEQSLAFAVVVDPSTLPGRGAWDIEIAPLRNQGTGPAVAFGSKRIARADTDGRLLGPDDDILTFTADGGNATVARSIRSLPHVTAERLQDDPDGRPEVVVGAQTFDGDLRVYADVTPAGSRDARQRLPWRRLDDGTVAVRLPVPHAVGALRTQLVVVTDGIRVGPSLDGLENLEIGHLTVRREEDHLTVTRNFTRGARP